MHLFKLRQGPIEGLSTAADTETDCTEHEKIDVRRTCLEAHEILMSLSASNAVKFKDVAQFLTEDLNKLKNGAVN